MGWYPPSPERNTREKATELSRQKKRWRKKEGVGLFSFGFSFYVKENLE